MDTHFVILKTDPQTQARLGKITTAHGVISTPAFMPAGTHGVVKTLTPEELKSIGVTILLSNAYHLYLRPGVEIVQNLGGLHRFMSWHGPILTDSGGYQIFSLAPLRRLNDEGVLFRSHIDGSEHFLTPESVTKLQADLGADIIMALDECPPFGVAISKVREATERTHRWAERCLKYYQRSDQYLYGIVQGGTFPQLRQHSAKVLASLEFSGYGLGGLGVGESKELTWAMVEEAILFLPENKPRYLMGIGAPEDIIEGVVRGIDLFDSALPTRIARNGALFTIQGRINIRNAIHKNKDEPIDSQCDCYTCSTFSLAYLHHLFKNEELLVYRLATIHNLRFIARLLEEIKTAIQKGNLFNFRKEFLDRYKTTNEKVRLEQKQKWLSNRKYLDYSAGD